MPNDISNSIHSSLKTPFHIQQKPTGSNQEIIKNITKLSNQALSMNEMENVLSSSATKRKSLENKYPGEVKRKYDPMRTEQNIDLLCNKVDFDTQQHSSSSHKNIVSNPGKVCNQQLSLEKLPTELIQNIAFKLDARSYFNMRSTSHGMREKLSSFEEVNTVFINKNSGELKKNYMSIYNKTIILQLKKEKSHDLINTLKSISVMSSTDCEYFSGPFVSIKFMLCDSAKSNYSVSSEDSDSDASGKSDSDISEELDCHILNEWCDMVTEEQNYKELNIRVNHGDFSPRDHSFTYDTTRFIFDANKIDKKYLKLFIDSLSALFIEYTDEERLILSITAYRLIEALEINTPINITKDDIIQYKSQYPILFGLGAALDNYLVTEKNGISSDYFKHHDYTH